MRQTAAAFTALVLCHLCPSWSQEGNATLVATCDQAAASPVDQNRPTGVAGVAPDKIDPKIAIPACDAAAKAAPNDPRIAFQLGRAYFAAKAYESARAQYAKADELGYALATNNLSVIYMDGLGVPADKTLALSLLEKAANGGIAIAVANLAGRYSSGNGVPKDDREAARLFKLAADQGNAVGQSNLGVFYRDGRGGLSKDDPEAARLFKLAADQRNAFAQNNLGVFYAQGRGGLAKDEGEAARLFAADKGNAAAQLESRVLL